MGNQQNFILLNGKRYDARTGKLLEDAPAQPSHSAATPAPVHHAPKSEHHTAPHANRHVQHSKTLMRHAVKKPHAVSTPVTTMVETPVAATFQPQTTQADKQRYHRAERVHQSRLITRWGATVREAAVPVKTAPIAVAEPPKTQPAPTHHATKPTHAAPAAHVAKPTPKTTEPFASALAAANGHEQPKLKKQRIHHKVARKLHAKPHHVSIAAAVMAALLLGGFFLYQNIPNLSMRVAATRAGVSAKLPGYQPVGFGMATSPKYTPGQVTVSFKSNTDAKRGFSIIQTKSGWNSDALYNNFVATQPHQTIETEDAPLMYMYNNDSLTWVKDGVWYRIEGNETLNSDQLLRIANSM